jgi:hypothetical protein
VADVVMDRKRVFGVESISRTGRCVDKMLHFIVSATLKDIERSHDITLYINFWMINGVANSSLCGQVNNPVWTALPENLINFFFVFQIVFVKGELVILSKNFEAVIFEGDVIIVVDVVKPDDFMA